jgi:predicted porin
MKKSLFAVAAAGAFAGVAGTAAAQSSVTVYGLLDMGYTGYNTRLSGGTTAGIPAVTQSTGSTFNSNGGESTSRLGFRGTEDIGGGLSAFFTIETAVTPNGQQAISSGATANRQTFVGLRKNGVGQASIGTQYTVIHDQVAVTDPGQANNIVGNLIYPTSTAYSNTASSSTGAGYTIRSNNMLKFATESMAGFKVNAFYALNNQNNTVTATTATSISGGTNNQYGWGLGADYTFKSFYVTANYQSFNSRNPYVDNGGGVGSNTTAISANTGVGTGIVTTNNTNGAPIAPGAVGGTAAMGQNIIDNQQYYAATYDFGILKAYAQYINRKVTNQYFSSNYTSRTAQQIGVRSFITPTVETWLSGGTGKYNGYGANGTQNNMTAWQVGGNYFLSKRTNLYAIYGAYAMSNAPGATSQGYTASTQTTQNKNSVSYNANNYAVGIRHTF